MNIKFVEQYLTNVTWNLDNEQWQVSGIINRISNEYLKFDIRFLKDFNNKKGKLTNSRSESDKILFEDNKNWILIDTQELIKYMKKNNLKEIELEKLINNIQWNIILPKK